MAEAIYYEARNQDREDQIAVAAVILNRRDSRRFPDSVCDVVRQGAELGLHQCQISFYCDGLPETPYNQEAWKASLELASDLLAGKASIPVDVQDALYYHATYVTPYWAASMTLVAKYGDHLFYAEDG